MFHVAVFGYEVVAMGATVVPYGEGPGTASLSSDIPIHIMKDGDV